MEPSSETQFVIGVDGGGTKTSACLVQFEIAEDSPSISEVNQLETSCNVIAEAKSGPANINRVGWESAKNCVEQAIDHVIRNAEQVVGHSLRNSVGGICLGLAGAGNESAVAKWNAFASERGWSQNVEVVNDAVPLFEFTNPHRAGIAVIAGTGSLVVLRDELQTYHRRGGWGARVGDPASGLWLGRELIRSVSEVVDGIRTGATARQYLYDWLSLKTDSALRNWIRNEDEFESRITALAPRICRAANEGEPICRGICDEAISYLVQLIQSIQVHTSADGFDLVLSGGLLVNDDGMAQGLLKNLAAVDCSPVQWICAIRPELGAARRAMRSLRRRDP